MILKKIGKFIFKSKNLNKILNSSRKKRSSLNSRAHLKSDRLPVSHLKKGSKDTSQFGSTNGFRAFDQSEGKETGDKLFKNQSAATLTHSILTYSFPKGERFSSHTRTKSGGSMYN